MTIIKYSGGYKYQLKQNYVHETRLCLDNSGVNVYFGDDFVKIYADGCLVIRHGYAWDGPSGPTIDTETFMRGSLVHDALYQLMRRGYIDKKYKNDADRILKEICIEDGMSKLRAWYVYNAVKMFGKFSLSLEI